MSGYEGFEVLDPSLKNIIEQKSLKWIFVGGKGGVGKTTTSCSLAVQLSKKRQSVLVISTDPAHNLSDAFDQKFSPNPTKVHGMNNLYCMELDSSVMKDFSSSILDNNVSDPGLMSSLTSLLNEFSSSIPGIDEAVSFGELMKQVQSFDYECIIFDTAPTGHTLRLLSFPALLEKASEKLNTTNILSKFSSLLGGSAESVTSKFSEMKELVGQVSATFKNPNLTTFICVAIPEFLSVYETERLVQELTKSDMDTHNIVVNQVLYPEPDSNCNKCKSRQKMQSKYIDQIYELYDNFHIVLVPLQDREVRGISLISQFSELLINPYVPPK